MQEAVEPPDTVAVIVVVPGYSAVTVPLASTEAMEESALAKVTVDAATLMLSTKAFKPEVVSTAIVREV